MKRAATSRVTGLEKMCALWLAALAVATIAGPYLMELCTGAKWDAQNLSKPLLAPSTLHPLGTDLLGRDMLVRLLVGARTSLSIGFTATLIAASIGLLIGYIAGYFGGRLDAIIMRIVEGFYSLPYIILVAVIMGLFHGGLVLLTVAIGCVSWLTMARVVRGQVMSICQKPYLDAARLMDLPPLRILVRHIVPNMLETLIVYSTLTAPAIILSETFLSFLGLGVSAPMVSLGVLVQEGAQAISVEPGLLAGPAVLLAITFFSLNTLGETLRDAARISARQL